MLTRRSMLSVLSGAMLLALAAPAAAQEIIQTGPPPELRKNLEAYQKAFNSGSADDYEAMAKATFTPEYLKRQTAEARKKEYTAWFAGFGSIRFARVQRDGDDVPLEIEVQGSAASGVMWIDLDDATSKLAGIRAEVAKKADANRRH